MNRVEHVERLGKKYDIEQISFCGLNKSYNVNNGFISFILDESCYVIPETPENLQELLDNDFRRMYIYVPFSNGGIPVDRYEDYEKVFC